MTLLAEAERGNPEIRAVEARRDAAAQVPSQTESLPDPLVSVSYTNESLSSFTLGSSPDSNLTVSWIQDLPYPGKRHLASEVAHAEVERGGRLVETTRLRVLAEVKALYAELRRIDQEEEIVAEARGILDSFVEAARARYQSGEGILENVLKAQTERTLLEAEQAVLAEERSAAASALNSALGRTADMPLGPAAVPVITASVDAATLEAAALERSPELMVLRAQTRTDETRLDVARGNLKPDFMWGAAYAHRAGLDPMVTGMFGVRLPLFRDRKQRAAVAEGELSLEASRRDAQAGELRLLAEVRDLVARANRARTLRSLYQEAILPQAWSALDSASAAYATGKTEFVTLLDDLRALLAARRESERQTADEAKALAALEPVTGKTLVVARGGEATGSPQGGSHE